MRACGHVLECVSMSCSSMQRAVASSTRRLCSVHCAISTCARTWVGCVHACVSVCLHMASLMCTLCSVSSMQSTSYSNMQLVNA